MTVDHMSQNEMTVDQIRRDFWRIFLQNLKSVGIPEEFFFAKFEIHLK